MLLNQKESVVLHSHQLFRKLVGLGLEDCEHIVFPLVLVGFSSRSIISASGIYYISLSGS